MELLFALKSKFAALATDAALKKIWMQSICPLLTSFYASHVALKTRIHSVRLHVLLCSWKILPIGTRRWCGSHNVRSFSSTASDIFVCFSEEISQWQKKKNKNDSGLSRWPLKCCMFKYFHVKNRAFAYRGETSKKLQLRFHWIIYLIIDCWTGGISRDDVGFQRDLTWK